MAGKSRAGQAGYHEGRDSLGRKAWLADEKDPQRANGDISRSMENLRKDLGESPEDAYDKAHEEITEAVDNFLDGLDEGHASDFISFQKGGWHGPTYRLDDFPDVYAQNAEFEGSGDDDFDMRIDFGSNDPIATAAQVRSLYGALGDNDSVYVIDQVNAVAYTNVSKLMDDESGEDLEELRDCLAAHMEYGLIDDSDYSEMLDYVGSHLIDPNEKQDKFYDLAWEAADDAVSEFFDYDDYDSDYDAEQAEQEFREQYHAMAMDALMDSATDEDVQSVFSDWMESGEITPDEIDFEYGSNTAYVTSIDSIILETVDRNGGWPWEKSEESAW